jgi:hypothetical protein
LFVAHAGHCIRGGMGAGRSASMAD